MNRLIYIYTRNFSDVLDLAELAFCQKSLIEYTAKLICLQYNQTKWKAYEEKEIFFATI